MPPRPLAEAEQDGVKFAAAAGVDSVAGLRAMNAEKIQQTATKLTGVRFGPVLDGFFLTKPIAEVFAAGEQAKIPLLAGSNSEEQPLRAVLGMDEPTPENFAKAVRGLYGDQADDVLKAYKVSSTDDVVEAATHLASARFVGLSTWKWTELQTKTGGQAVYRYLYAHIRPQYTPLPAIPFGVADAGAPGRGGPRTPHGASHSSEIQYAMGNLYLDKRYAWTTDDYKISATIQDYFVNFVKTGNPNGRGLPKWPPYSSSNGYQRMRFDIDSHAEPETDRARYLALDREAKP